MPKTTKQFPIISPIHAEEDKIMEPFWYLRRNKKTDLSTLRFCEAFNEWIKLPKEQFDKIYQMIDIWFDAGIMCVIRLDDLYDGSTVRRGLPAVNCVYGDAFTINTVMYAFFYGLQKVLDILPAVVIPAAFEKYTRIKIAFYRGQGAEILWRESYTCPTQEQYLDMAHAKTGGVILYIEFMQLFSDDKRDYTHLVKLLSQYFQIRDDYANLTSPDYFSEQGFCGDITEGKFSFPIMHAVSSCTEDTTILDILKQRTTDRKLLQLAVDRVAAIGSFDYTLKVLKEYEGKICTEIDRLGGNEKLTALIVKLSDMFTYFN